MYQILLDQWEGNLDIDDGLIKASGVAGVMSRINSIPAVITWMAAFSKPGQTAGSSMCAVLILFITPMWMGSQISTGFSPGFRETRQKGS